MSTATITIQHAAYRPRWASRGSSNLDVASAAAGVLSQLADLDLVSLGISEYNQRYLKEKFAKPEYEACVTTFMLSYVLQVLPADLSNMTLVDFGAGSGLISLVAKRLGVGNVVFCDIFEQSCIDGRRIADSLGFVADHYVCGDLKDVGKALEASGAEANAVVSHNVIEHVYDMNELFEDMQKLPQRELCIWHSTSANPLRPKTVTDLSKLARKVENEDRKAGWGHKQRNALQSYYSIRRDMITELLPEADSLMVEQFAKATRGLQRKDIEAVVEAYRETGQFTATPEHATNTCDPHTGNWCERLMDPFALTRDAKNFGINLEVASGLWCSDRKSYPKSLTKQLMNAFIGVAGTSALRFSPYYILRGQSVRS